MDPFDSANFEVLQTNQTQVVKNKATGELFTRDVITKMRPYVGPPVGQAASPPGTPLTKRPKAEVGAEEEELQCLGTFQPVFSHRHVLSAPAQVKAEAVREEPADPAPGLPAALAGESTDESGGETEGDDDVVGDEWRPTAHSTPVPAPALPVRTRSAKAPLLDGYMTPNRVTQSQSQSSKRLAEVKAALKRPLASLDVEGLAVAQAAVCSAWELASGAHPTGVFVCAKPRWAACGKFRLAVYQSSRNFTVDSLLLHALLHEQKGAAAFLYRCTRCEKRLRHRREGRAHKGTGNGCKAAGVELAGHCPTVEQVAAVVGVRKDQLMYSLKNPQSLFL